MDIHLHMIRVCVYVCVYVCTCVCVCVCVHVFVRACVVIYYMHGWKDREDIYMI